MAVNMPVSNRKRIEQNSANFSTQDFHQMQLYSSVEGIVCMRNRCVEKKGVWVRGSVCRVRPLSLKVSL